MLGKTGIIHLINPKTRSFTTRPMYFGRALYSPLAGLLTVAGLIPQDKYEVVLTDENIEDIDFDMRVDMVGISLCVEPGEACYVPLIHKDGASDDLFGSDELAEGFDNAAGRIGTRMTAEQDDSGRRDVQRQS